MEGEKEEKKGGRLVVEEEKEKGNMKHKLKKLLFCYNSWKSTSYVYDILNSTATMLLPFFCLTHSCFLWKRFQEL